MSMVPLQIRQCHIFIDSCLKLSLQFFKTVYFQESWQHLLRDRASRTLTYNDEQFHILEKIKMSETIKVIEDLLLKVTNCLKFISSFIIFIELILVQGYLWSFYFKIIKMWDSFKIKYAFITPQNINIKNA